MAHRNIRLAQETNANFVQMRRAKGGRREPVPMVSLSHVHSEQYCTHSIPGLWSLSYFRLEIPYGLDPIKHHAFTGFGLPEGS
jgi:hypothetical protein